MLKTAVTLLGATAAAAARVTIPFKTGPVTNQVDWAVLVAGSNTWGNFRHQADIAHAYQIMHKHGIPDDNIIVFMYDDLAQSSENPHPGTLINKPGGEDVYTGCLKDYTGRDVSADNVLNVLKGDAEAMAGIGSGKVLKAGPDDHVLFVFADHGAPGILGMPSPSPYLYGSDLVKTITDMSSAGAFGQMTLYIEACESGSLFEGTLEDNINIYAITAANAQESSWGYYCPGFDPAPPPGYNTCLGDLFSISWMEDSDASDLSTETLYQQYAKVKERTSQGGTYDMGSHVMMYGQTDIANETVSEFMGDAAKKTVTLGQTEWAQGTGIAQRDADLHYLWTKYVHAVEDEAKALAKAAFHAELDMREAVDSAVKGAVSDVLNVANMLPEFADQMVDDIMTGVRPEGQVLVDDWDCFKGMVSAWEGSCGRLPEYGMKHTRSFANLCNKNISPASLGAAAGHRCAGTAASTLSA